MTLRPISLIVTVAMLATAGRAQAQDRPKVSDPCPVGRDGEYVVWNFSDATATLFDPKDIEDELVKIRGEAADKLGFMLAPPLQAHVCTNAALQRKLENRDHLADLGNFVLVGLSAKGKAFQVHIIPYIVNYNPGVASEPLGLTTNWECKGDGPSPSVNEYRSDVRAYAYAALALTEIRLLESRRDPCRARQAQFFLERALSAVSRRPVSRGSDPLAIAQLQQYLEAKRAGLKPLIEAAAQSGSQCGMPMVSSRLPQLLTRTP